MRSVTREKDAALVNVTGELCVSACVIMCRNDAPLVGHRVDCHVSPFLK